MTAATRPTAGPGDRRARPATRATRPPYRAERRARPRWNRGRSRQGRRGGSARAASGPTPVAGSWAECRAGCRRLRDSPSQAETGGPGAITSRRRDGGTEVGAAMKMNSCVHYELDGHVATITYDRPDALNTING